MEEEFINSIIRDLVTPVAGLDIPISDRTAIVFDERMLLHCDPDNDHPEQPTRLSFTWENLAEQGILSRCFILGLQQLINDSLINTVHDPNQLQELRRITSTYAFMATTFH